MQLRRPSPKDLLGALLLAFGTIFQMKPRPDDHWSQRPGVEAMADVADEAAGGGKRRPRRRGLPATA